ncbi:hypothetical protein Tgr7_2599 [Thioalkalivibrio sulfidiphilus HL-EbGr7]|uniref:Uncharacterized protein n=1 Tax=Thioalkalivibrio sulfidiphilus (strain HL-EbGR7) TaxID=396588 RepID=B8GM87_THISH|nr:hypothetical protein [Thioalkalivibrio sulfidiphilus]ACL73674.1 hypothetical protein Tgr7_2599 [Thioalkalivibrio sulfidiphilus HL-EbGr7]
MTELNIRSGRRRLSTLASIPWTLVIILYMVVVHYSALDMSGITGYVFIGLGVFVLFVEFFKSGDINAAAFLIDLSSAVLSLIVATVLLSYLYFSLDQVPTFYHWFGFAIILGDAILSPFNAFRTALRNLGLGVST